LRSCSLDGLPSNVAAKVRLEQVNSLSVVLAVMSVTGISTVLLLNYEYVRVFPWRVALGTSVVLIACYIGLLITSMRWNLKPNKNAVSAEFMLRRLTRVCLVLGSAWALVLNALMARSAGADRSLLYAVIVGLMSAPVVATPPAAAMAFWVPLTAGGMFAICVFSPVRDIGGTCLLTGYTMLTLFCLLHLNRCLIRRVVAELQQADGRETINMLLRDFEDSACDWLWETDAAGRLTHVSNRFAEVSHLSVNALLGLDMVRFTEARLRQLSPGAQRRPEDRAGIGALMEIRSAFRDHELPLLIEGERVWWSLTGKPKYSAQGLFDGYRGVGSDITERKAATDRADFLAQHDELTGLASRRPFRDILARYASSTRAMPLALLCLDLDGFKDINDHHGHPVGDLLLKAVAKRLAAQVRERDFCARLGGDEFAVVIPNANLALLPVIAGRIISELSKPHLVDGKYLEVGVSIGVAISQSGEQTSEALLQNADVALYQAKSEGRSTWRQYDAALSMQHNRRRLLQMELQASLEDRRFRLEYQPIFDLETGALDSLEALARWQRPSGEPVSPAEFITIMEDSRQIEDLGEWVLEQACRDVAAMPPGIKLAVNVSPIQLRSRRIIEALQRALLNSQLDPKRLALELTETAFFEIDDATLSLLREIRGFGVGINLDDFGVGQTSLTQLRRFPFNVLKIDQSFIRDMPTNKSANAIVRGLASMAADLGIHTTAEGIETAEQLALVTQAGCKNAQGYFLHRPEPIGSILHLAKREAAAPWRGILLGQTEG
jgi:diguanylate cyclase (GGDEF)-like protein